MGALLLTFCVSLLAINGEVNAAPHILMMVLDDVGRADTGIYGKSNINMPRLKSLANDGVVFENFYAQTVCSPTRSSLMTGQYPFRFGMQHYTVSLLYSPFVCVHRYLTWVIDSITRHVWWNSTQYSLVA